MVDILVGIQVAWLGRAEELLAIGLPDWRASALTAAIADLVERAGAPGRGRGPASRSPTSSRDCRRGSSAIAACGLGDGLVHGDCHPGNVRGEGSNLVLLDWGDCGVGHPLLDMPGFLDRIDPDAGGTRPRPLAGPLARPRPGLGSRARRRAHRPGRGRPDGARSTSGSSTGSSRPSTRTTRRTSRTGSVGRRSSPAPSARPRTSSPGRSPGAITPDVADCSTHGHHGRAVDGGAGAGARRPIPAGEGSGAGGESPRVVRRSRASGRLWRSSR